MPAYLLGAGTRRGTRQSCCMSPRPPSQSQQHSWARACLPWRSWHEALLLPTTREHQFFSLCWNNISERFAAQVTAQALLHSVSPGDLECVHGPTCNLNVKMHWGPGDHHGVMHLRDCYMYQKDQFTTSCVKRCDCFLRCRQGTVHGEDGRESRAAPSVPRVLSQQHCLSTLGTRKNPPPILSLPTHGCWDMHAYMVLCHFPKKRGDFLRKTLILLYLAVPLVTKPIPNTCQSNTNTWKTLASEVFLFGSGLVFFRFFCVFFFC